MDPGVPDRVLGDPHRLRQVLTNLIGNAIKFTHKGEIAVEVFPLALQNGRALLSFEVRDTGIGMAPETISQLFEPFVQADDSNTRNYGGMGLGLAIVRRLVTLMGGRIDVSSRPGGGSAFTFSLPFDAIYDAVGSRVDVACDHARQARPGDGRQSDESPRAVRAAAARRVRCRCDGDRLRGAQESQGSARDRRRPSTW